MERRIVREEVYIPDIEENRVYDNEKKKGKYNLDGNITVRLKYLTPGEYQSCFKLRDGKVSQDIPMTLRLAVQEINGLTLIDDKTDERYEVTGADDIIDNPGTDDLFYGILKRVNSMNARVGSKN